MTEGIQEIFKRKSVPIGFERTMGLLGATTLGIGALMGAGIYVLIGIAAGRAGPSVWLSYLICGVLSLISVAMFGELSRRMPIAGGGYSFAYTMIGSLGGFMTGWLLVLGSIFACAMYAIGFAYYMTSIFAQHLPEIAMRGIAVVIVALLTALNCYGSKGGDRLQRVFTYGNLLVLLLLVVLAVPHAKPEGLRPMFPNGIGGIGSAIAIIYVSFFGYQLIANNAEEIVHPTKTIPRAMLLSMGVSLSFYVALALVSVMVVPWETLSQSNAPLIEVALKGIGRLGWFIVALGGILASAAALNSTLLSQARQIFAMGRDKFLPSSLGRINEVYRTPVAALLIGGVTTILGLIFGNLTFLVKSANFCFIVSLLPISLTLKKLYRSSGPADRPGWLKRFLPEGALVSNLALLTTMDRASLAFGLWLIGAGAFLFLFYSRRREVRSRTGMSVVLTEEVKSPHFRGQRVLVPVANPQTQPTLFSISEALLSEKGGELVLLNVVLVRNQMAFRSAVDEAADSLQILETGIQLPKLENVKLRPVVRLSRSLAKGIAQAAEEEGCSLIVMGYAGEESPQSIRLMEEVLTYARTDMILFKQKGEFRPKRIAVSLGSKINLNLMVKLAGDVADHFGGEITFLNILPSEYSEDQKQYSAKILMEAIRQHAAKALYHIDLLSSDEPLQLLIKRSADFDLLIVGTTKVGLLERVIVGTFSSQIVMNAECSVAVVKSAPQVKKLLKV
jgi:amino acid transporter/nucleotide-binding universal stress UspA family protein